MRTHVFTCTAAILSAIVLALLLCTGVNAQDKSGAEQIPQKVMEGLKAKFPSSEIRKWTKEDEAGITVYDIEFTQGGQNFEADIKEDGTIHNWERAIGSGDLPAAVRKAIDARYPHAEIRETMIITAVKDARDELEGYEIVLMTADKKEVEVTVAPDGRFVEDSGEAKKEE
jgi:hypothetical protein